MTKLRLRRWHLAVLFCCHKTNYCLVASSAGVFSSTGASSTTGATSATGAWLFDEIIDTEKILRVAIMVAAVVLFALDGKMGKKVFIKHLVILMNLSKN